MSEPRMTLGRWVGTNPSLRRGGEQSDIGKPEHWASGPSPSVSGGPESGELSPRPSAQCVPLHREGPRGAPSVFPR